MLRTLTGFALRTTRVASTNVALPVRRVALLRSIETPAKRVSAVFGSGSVRGLSSKIEGLHPDFQPKQAAPANEQSKADADSAVQDSLAEIKKVVDGNDVVIYMKGYPDAPQCGFSRTACLVLDAHDVEFTGVNVLESPIVRESIKKFTNWPTIPQIFVKGEFIGGCDILLEMHRDGSLDKLLREKNLKKTQQQQ